jgi:hypothetical protein
MTAVAQTIGDRLASLDWAGVEASLGFARKRIEQFWETI